ncbi:sensor histidine kinase [Chitinilyticum litopenaei]|uniref:sensor histidine kinase n=1 Tax=Chitinilyticum litopenaei TaxID=1121276 RepID=UPI00041A1AEB|nr:ATP-binding protein [Chitinilyticum litopenaei]
MKRLLLVFAALGAVLLFMLATAAGNESAFSEYYDVLLTLNLLLLGGMAALVIGHLYRLLKRVRSKVFGSRLMLRLMLMFALVAVLPGALVYTLSVQFLNRSIETWFDVRVDNALDKGLNLGHTAIDFQLGELARKAQVIAWDVHDNPSSTMLTRLTRLRDTTGVQEITLFDEYGGVAAHIGNERASLIPPQPDRKMLRKAAVDGYSGLEDNLDGTLDMRVLVQLPGNTFSDKKRYLQLIQPVPQQLAQDAELVEQVRSEYKQLSHSRQGLKMIFSLTLTIALLVALLGALVLALYLSDKLAAPLSLLAAGTKAVAQGDFSQQQPVVSRDELGILTHSFNRMTRQLAETRAKLELNQAEQAAAKAYVEAILGSISAGVLSFDEDCLLQSTNLSALRILGLDPAKVDGQPLGRWHEEYPVLANFCAQVLRGVLSDDEHWQCQVELAGDKRVLLVHGTRLSGMPDQFDIMGGFVVVFDDITDLLAAQRDAAWGEVARRLAHEIKNPLTPIQLAAERMEHKLADKLEPQAAELLTRNTQTIVKQVAALKQMVDAFRDYARKPSGKLHPLDLAQLLREVLVLYEAAPIEQHGIPVAPVMVKGDATHLRQVIHNLLQNAQDAIRESTEPKVCIHCEKDEKWARLNIADNGPGFSSELLPRVFEPYITTKTKGTGLGLAIVKKIIEEHHGRIQVGNLPTGGAFVRIELPLWEDVISG